MHLSKIADSTPAFGRQQERVIMHFRRWRQNPYVTWETFGKRPLVVSKGKERRRGEERCYDSSPRRLSPDTYP